MSHIFLHFLDICLGFSTDTLTHPEIFIFILELYIYREQPNSNQIKVALFTFANKYPLIRFLL